MWISRREVMCRGQCLYQRTVRPAATEGAELRVVSGLRDGMPGTSGRCRASVDQTIRRQRKSSIGCQVGRAVRFATSGAEFAARRDGNGEAVVRRPQQWRVIDVEMHGRRRCGAMKLAIGDRSFPRIPASGKCAGTADYGSRRSMMARQHTLMRGSFVPRPPKSKDQA